MYNAYTWSYKRHIAFQLQSDCCTCCDPQTATRTLGKVLSLPVSWGCRCGHLPLNANPCLSLARHVSLSACFIACPFSWDGCGTSECPLVKFHQHQENLWVTHWCCSLLANLYPPVTSPPGVAVPPVALNHISSIWRMFFSFAFFLLTFMLSVCFTWIAS
jgi:hypothetical protein